MTPHFQSEARRPALTPTRAGPEPRVALRIGNGVRAFGVMRLIHRICPTSAPNRAARPGESPIRPESGTQHEWCACFGIPGRRGRNRSRSVRGSGENRMDREGRGPVSKRGASAELLDSMQQIRIGNEYRQILARRA